ncbi:MAG: DUF4394 domain-containing protein [Ferruginibacter sp.]
MNTLKKNFKQAATCIALACFALTACNKNEGENMETPGVPGPDLVFYGLAEDNKIVRYNAKNAAIPEKTIDLTNVPVGEKMLSIDFRPATGQLYALGASSRLYFINLTSGNVTALGTASFTPALTGTIANLDFNPTVDRVRVVTNAGQNLRLNPETGTVAFTDGNINGGTSPSITSIAYTNSIAGATTTELFDIEVSSKKLYKQMPPNDGTLVEVGTINVDFTGKGGFDISPDNSAALATFTVKGVNKLYLLNTTTANATYLSKLSEKIIDIAIPTNPVAYAVCDDSRFQIFDPTKSNSSINKAITGVGVGESIVGLDFRPANGQLYGVALTALGTARLYTFNLSSGAAAPVGTGFSVNVATTAVGFDFNPTVDRIRMVTNIGQNLRLNPIDGTIAATDGNLNPGSPAISGAAYTNNFAGSTTTSLFVLDMGKLYKQDPPNNGTLIEIGSLGVTASAQNGFDIGGTSNMGYALFTVGSSTKVYTINTTTGAATATVDFPIGVKAMAVGLGF